MDLKLTECDLKLTQSILQPHLLNGVPSFGPEKSPKIDPKTGPSQLNCHPGESTISFTRVPLWRTYTEDVVTEHRVRTAHSSTRTTATSTSWTTSTTTSPLDGTLTATTTCLQGGNSIDSVRFSCQLLGPFWGHFYRRRSRKVNMW